MPAKKPASLLARHDLKTDRKQRTDGEAALQPRDPLRLKPPQQLTGHKVASTLWRRMIEMYQGLTAEIVSRMDEDMLVDYCILYEQSIELDKLRTAAMKNYDKAQKTLNKKAEKNEIDPKILIKWLNSVNWSLGEIVKLDARVDRKRALLHTLRQSLYLTPRSRAGVAPQEKPPEKPKSKMDNILAAGTKLKPHAK
jgi:phage terminase small subunit